MSRLIKSTVGSPPVAIGGSAGSPATPERTVSEWVFIFSFHDYYIVSSSNYVGPQYGFLDWYITTHPGIYRVENFYHPGVSEYTLITVYELQTVTYPATAGTPTIAGTIDPDQLRAYLNQGWNSYARSISSILPGQYLEFRVLDSTAAAMMILSYVGREGLFGTSETNQGFVIDETGIYLLDSGGVATSFGGRTPSLVLYMYRLVDGRIAFRVGGVIHVNNAVLNRFSPLYAYGMLYQGLDEISYAEIKTGTLSFPEAAFSGVGTLAASFSPTVLFSGVGTIITEKKIEATLSGVSNLYAEFDVRNRGSGILPLFSGTGADYESGAGSASLPVFYSIPFLDPYGFGYLPYFSGYAYGSDHDVGQGASLLPLFTGIGADYEYGFGAASLPLQTSRGYGGFVPDDMMVMFDAITASSSFTQVTDIVMFLTSNGALSSTYSMTRAQVLEMLSSISGSSIYTVSGIYAVSLLSDMSGLSVQSLSVNNLPDLQSSGVVWVVNMNTQASGQYEQYGFNSFFERSGTFYGVAGDGIYKLEGSTDSGSAIKALADMGKSNFGIRERKTVPYIYLGVSSTQKMILKAVVDGKAYHYMAKTSSTDMRNQRVDLGKGLRGTHWQLVVENSDGCDFSLSGIEFTPVELSRSI